MRVLILGVGLIGGSLALDLRARGAVVTGHGRNPAALQDAVRAGVLDAVSTDLPADVADADVVVLGVPVGAMRAAMAAVAPALRTDALLMDVGSTKASVVADAAAVWGTPPPQFVPAHPLAGGEHTGFAHARADLFQGRRVVLTPQPGTAPAALARARTLWTDVGAQVLDMTPTAHDAALAATSHLPHVAAFALMAALGARADAGALWPLAAGGLRDTTRIAGSDPALWRDICLANTDAVRAVLADYRNALTQADAALAAGDGAALEALFAQGRHARDALMAA